MSSIEHGESLALTEAPAAAVPGADPTFLDRLAARLVRGVLTRVEHGRVLMTFPDGTVERFGQSGAEVRVPIRKWSAFRRLLLGGDTGAAEAYRDGDWDAEDLVAVVSLFVANAELFDRETPLSLASDALNRARHALRRNTRRKAKRNIEAHYDLGNDFYGLFLDSGMTYSCALFESADETLEAAQERKLRRVASLARLTPGDSILEIGCGWGSFATLAAREYGCRVVGLTLSSEQADFARRRVEREGLSDRVEIRLADY
ncbi:MAG TPA: class I SAM-dependent methyltransferase, partial [Thermoanaerobaculia bacterium]|nr:class I SAM-dependent methyltransferase [Thermoanaerobaculia bacterium]